LSAATLIAAYPAIVGVTVHAAAFAAEARGRWSAALLPVAAELLWGADLAVATLPRWQALSSAASVIRTADIPTRPAILWVAERVRALACAAGVPGLRTARIAADDAAGAITANLSGRAGNAAVSTVIWVLARVHTLGIAAEISSLRAVSAVFSAMSVVFRHAISITAELQVRARLPETTLL
jgi:hypothetical protein